MYKETQKTLQIPMVEGMHISIETLIVRRTCTKTSANTLPSKTHTYTHMLLPLPLLFMPNLSAHKWLRKELVKLEVKMALVD